MPIDTTVLQTQLQSVTATTLLQLEQVATTMEVINNSLSVTTVPKAAALPSASANTGSYIFSLAEKQMWFSNGTSWVSAAAPALSNDPTNGSTSLLASAASANSITTIANSAIAQAVLTQTHELWMCGYNGTGALGQGSPNGGIQSFNMVEGENWAQAVTNGLTTLAVDANGNLWGWGGDFNGGWWEQYNSNNTQYSPWMLDAPVSTTYDAEGVTQTGWRSVAISKATNPFNPQHVAAIDNSGHVWCWGYNSYGELGNNSTTNSFTPAQVTGFPNPIVQVSCGYCSTMAIDSAGGLWAWGLNDLGQLGTNDTNNYSTPTYISGGWSSVSMGNFSVAGIKVDGTLWTWGLNDQGQLGQGGSGFGGSFSTPQQVTSPSQNWAQCSMGYQNLCAVTTTGALWGSGYNGNGELGLGSTTPAISMTQEATYGTNWTSVASGENHTLGVQQLFGGKYLYSTGLNTNYQLGNPVISGSAYMMTQVPIYPNVQYISAGGNSSLLITSSLYGKAS